MPEHNQSKQVIIKLLLLLPITRIEALLVYQGQKNQGQAYACA
jgi:hypothetical protein